MKTLLLGTTASALLAFGSAMAQTQPVPTQTPDEQETAATQKAPKTDTRTSSTVSDDYNGQMDAAPTNTARQQRSDTMQDEATDDTWSTQTADAQDDMDEMDTDVIGTTVSFATDEMSAKDLLGAEVIGVSGERVARIDDLEIGDDGQITRAVILSGGFFGLGGTKAAIDFDQLDISYDRNMDPQVSVALSEANIEQVAEYEQDDLNNYRLASEMIGAAATLQGTDEQRTITDLVVSMNGSVSRAVTSDGLLASFGGDRRAIDFDRVMIEQGDGGVVIDLSAEEFGRSPMFSYDVATQTERTDAITPDRRPATTMPDTAIESDVELDMDSGETSTDE